jgi:hypothetical protein
MVFLTASLLEHHVPGLETGKRTMLAVQYLGTGKAAYHQYEGGPIWMATTPACIGRPGQSFDISAKLLTKDDFVRELPPVSMKNKANFNWLPSSSRILRASRSGSRLEIQQAPSLEGISNFAVQVETATELGFAPGKGCFLEMALPDFFGRKRRMRFYHDGCSEAWLGLRRGRRYPRISLVCFDGVRLRLAYSSPAIRVATVYLGDPASIYTVASIGGPLRSPKKNSRLSSLGTYRTKLKRAVESEMLLTRYRYPHGRIGSEVAYSIAKREFGFGNLILNDPSEGGADMMAEDGKVIFENRLVTITRAMSEELRERQIEFQLGRLELRLRSDLAYYPAAQVGYVFLSYLSEDNLQTLVFEMKK